MTAVAERPAYELSGDDILTELDTLHHALSRTQTRRLELLARLDDLGHAKDLGARDTTELLALRHRLDPATVRRDVKLARALPRYTVVTAALPGHAQDSCDAGSGDGERGVAGVRIHPGQAQVIVEALERVPSTVPDTDRAVAETEMVTAARILGPRDLRRLGTAIVAALDPDGPAPAEDTARTAETLWLTRGTAPGTAPGTGPGATGSAAHGIRFGGFLAAENAELFQTLIDAAAKPRKTATGDLDPRTLGQRRADALVTILHAAATTGDGIPTHGGVKPHITVTITLDDLRHAGANATGDPTFGTGLSAAAVRRLACDAGITPIILGTTSQPLDVGREQRLVTPAIRRALIARDGGCVIDGCDAPPAHTDAHHIIHWANGGTTSLDNLVLGCKPHHRAIHDGIWTIHITNGTVHVTRPTWTEPHPQPPDPEPP